MLGDEQRTGRGFRFIEFADANAVPCTLQASSAIGDSDSAMENPGTSFVWLGCEDANPRVMVPGQGWVKHPMPAEYLADTRMHLSRDQVRYLVAHLEAWLETGSFSLTPATPAKH